MEKENIVREICENMNVSSNDIDDFVQEVYMILLEYNPEKLIELYTNKQLKFFLVGIIRRQYHSCTSPYYKKYKKYYSIVDENHINKSELNNEEVDDFE